MLFILLFSLEVAALNLNILQEYTAKIQAMIYIDDLSTQNNTYNVWNDGLGRRSRIDFSGEGDFQLEESLFTFCSTTDEKVVWTFNGDCYKNTLSPPYGNENTCSQWFEHNPVTLVDSDAGSLQKLSAWNLRLHSKDRIVLDKPCLNGTRTLHLIEVADGVFPVRYFSRCYAVDFNSFWTYDVYYSELQILTPPTTSIEDTMKKLCPVSIG